MTSACARFVPVSGYWPDCCRNCPFFKEEHEPLTCYCGAKFWPSGKQKYCSPGCSNRWRRMAWWHRNKDRINKGRRK